MSVFRRALLLTVRHCARSRAILQLELLALRHQLQVLQRTRPRRVRLGENGALALGVAFARVDRLATRPRRGETGDGRRLAPPWLSDLLDLEEPPTPRPTDH